MASVWPVRRENKLSELFAISTNYDHTQTHVVFVHGLSGHPKKTWTGKGTCPPILWPAWLAEDLPGIGLWLVGYPAAKTNWGGYGLPLSDRADNILARLLAEARLENGNIIFVTHSLGGLVVEQLLRNAQRDAGSNRKAENFLSRVRRVVFLGTPHRGVLLANVGKAVALVVRPSAATRDLVLGNPQLRDLNFWYRQYSRDNGIENLTLVEGRPERVFGITLPEIVGTIVLPGSADAGLADLPITVDEDHTGISKPATRDAEVYIYVRDFIARPFGAAAQVTQTVEALGKNTTELQRLTESTQSHSEAIADLTRVIVQSSGTPRIDPALIDAEIARRLERVRKCRLFGVFNTTDEARNFAAALQEGELTMGSDGAKAIALAWCARLLSTPHPDEAEAILNGIATPDPELSRIAQGLVVASRGDLSAALGRLATIGTPLAYGAAYICVLRTRGSKDALSWLEEAGLSLADLDSDAKFFCLKQALDGEEWDAAFEVAKELHDADFDRSPGLIFAAAVDFHQELTRDFRRELTRLSGMFRFGGGGQGVIFRGMRTPFRG